MQEVQKYYIYIIQNIIKLNEVYVGFTKNFEKRKSEHLRRAKKCVKENDFLLYRSMRKCKSENFNFFIIEEYQDKAEALNAEETMISYLKGVGATLYNTQSGGYNSDGFKGKKHSEISKDKIKNSLIENGHPIWENGHSEETKNKMSMYYRSLSDQQIIDLRKDLVLRELTYTELILKYKVSRSVIGRVRRSAYEIISSNIIAGTSIQKLDPKLKIKQCIRNLIRLDIKNKVKYSDIKEKYGCCYRTISIVKYENEERVNSNKRNLRGEDHPLFGIGHSLETKKLLSKKALDRMNSEGYVHPLKGRSGELMSCFGRTGDKHPNTKISEERIILLRAELKLRKKTLTLLSKEYGVSIATISLINSGKARNK